MLADSKLLIEFWNKAIVTSVYLKNRVITKGLVTNRESISLY